MGVGIKSHILWHIVIYACGVAGDGQYTVGYANVELRREDWGANL